MTVTLTIDNVATNLNPVQGTTGNDTLTGQSGSIHYGLEGDDTLNSSFFAIPTDFSQPPVFPNMLVGGDGNDTYNLVPNSFNIIGELGRSGNDTVNLQGINFADATISEHNDPNGNLHLIIYDNNDFQPTTVILNWKEFETFNFADQSITMANLDAQVAAATTSVSDQFEFAATAFGYTGTAEMIAAIAQATADNNALHQSTPTLTPTESADILTGTTAAEFIRGLGGNDVIDGAGGNDTINGNRGNDTLKGGDGNDTIFGGKDVDSVTGNQGDDRINADIGNDTLRGGQGNDFVNGNSDNDQVFGDIGNDEVHGGAGNDFVSGGDGNDTVFGDKGNDTLNGGAGNDVFVFQADSGVDTIEDFTQGQDTLQISASIFATKAAAVAAFSGGTLDLGNGNSVTLTGVSTLTEADVTIA